MTAWLKEMDLVIRTKRWMLQERSIKQGVGHVKGHKLELGYQKIVN